MTLSFYPIPSLCLCGCNEITWNGRKYKNGHFIRINNPTKDINVCKKISISRMGSVPWNKGLTKDDDERINKASKIQSVKRMGKIPWNKGIPRTIKERNKISLNHANFSKENHPNWKGGISFLPYCPRFNEIKKEEIRNEYNRKCYFCGKTEEEQIKEMKEKGKRPFRLSIHHLDLDKEQGCNGKEWKLIPLCLVCHRKIHSNKIHNSKSDTK